MRVDHPERRGLLAQMHEDPREHRVLDHVGEIPGMEGVAVIHGCRRMGARLGGCGKFEKNANR